MKSCLCVHDDAGLVVVKVCLLAGCFVFLLPFFLFNSSLIIVPTHQNKKLFHLSSDLPKAQPGQQQRLAVPASRGEAAHGHLGQAGAEDASDN